MGEDKAFLKLGGKPLIAHVIGALEDITDSIILVSGDERLDVYGKKRQPDLIADVGPLAGLYTGLSASRTEYNLVLGCDTPLVNKTLFEILLEQASRDYEVVQLAGVGQTMPLIALYRKSCMSHIRELIRQGERRLQESVSGMKTKTIAVDAAMERYMLNINTREDLDHIRRLFNDNN
jgi:molybdopterin-guanine dinucleotide biosynthesis protein A